MSNQSKPKPSLADLLRVWVKNQMDKKYDYSLATNRKLDIQNFIDSHKGQLNEQQLKINTVRSSYTPILDKEFESRGLNPSTMNRSVKGTSKKLHYNSDLNANITPSAQAGVNDTSPKKPTPQDQQQQQQQIIQPAYDEASVSATFSALFLTFRMVVPDIELLTQEEKNALGKMWLPAFNLYMSNEKWAVIGIPIMGTLGIFLPKILEGRKQGKIRKSKLEGNLRQKEIDDKNENREKEIDQLKQNQQRPHQSEVLPKKE